MLLQLVLSFLLHFKQKILQELNTSSRGCQFWSFCVTLSWVLRRLFSISIWTQILQAFIFSWDRYNNILNSPGICTRKYTRHSAVEENEQAYMFVNGIQRWFPQKYPGFLGVGPKMLLSFLSLAREHVHWWFLSWKVKGCAPRLKVALQIFLCFKRNNPLSVSKLILQQHNHARP